MTDLTARAPGASFEVRLDSRLIRLIRDDITTLEAEAFVFYARPGLELGSGFGSAITRRGGPAIKHELDAIGRIGVTGAVVTSGGNLPARHIVHAVGPAFQEPDTEAKLGATIVNALRAAEAAGIAQVALPAMGAGFYGIPLPVCVRVMVDTLATYLSGDPAIRQVIICANDWREYRAFQAALAARAPEAAASPAVIGMRSALETVND